MPRPAFAEPAPPHNASALLDEAKTIDYERKVAAKKKPGIELGRKTSAVVSQYMDAFVKRAQQVYGE